MFLINLETLEKVERERGVGRERHLMKSGENIVKVDHTAHRPGAQLNN